MDQLEERIKVHEGLRLKVYHDSAGVTTIGYGRNLEGRGISEAEAEFLFQNDLAYAKDKFWQLPPFVQDNCNELRRGVVVEMIFQLGFGGVCRFRRMLEAIRQRDFAKAADEMLDSTWAKQTPNRAKELSEIMRNGN